MQGVLDGGELHLFEAPLKLRVKVRHKAKPLQIHDALLSWTVRDLKFRIEELTGVVVRQQRLRYLEDVDLENTLALMDYDIVANAMLEMHLWSDWEGGLGIIGCCFLGGFMMMNE